MDINDAGLLGMRIEKMSRMLRTIILVTLMLITAGSAVQAENFVNWRGGFWFSVPEGWDKVNYRTVDRFLAYTDTTREVFNYEAVFAPETSRIFAEDAYLVVTFDSTGEMSKREADSVLRGIASSYSTDVYDAPLVQLMTDLIPGKPKINLSERSVSVLTEMAYRQDAMKKLWLYMQLNDHGLISLYLYSPDSTFERNKKVFDDIVGSLSFDDLKGAAVQEEFTFTEVAGGDGEASSAVDFDDDEGFLKSKILYALIVIVVFGLLWNFIIAPRIKKKQSATRQ